MAHRSSRLAALVLVAGAVALSSAGASSADTNGGNSGAAQQCGGWDVEYTLAANLQLTDTPMGKGNGTYKIGPGTALLHFDDQGGQPGGHVRLISYTMKEQFTITAKTLGFTTTVVTDSASRATPDKCGVAADGTLSPDDKVVWSTKVHGYRTDGTLDCNGSLCGTFGAPPSGKSELHIGPSEVQFRPFEMSKDLKTFSMPYTFASKTKSPQQTAYVAVSGREVKRTCVPAPKQCP